MKNIILFSLAACLVSSCGQPPAQNKSSDINTSSGLECLDLNNVQGPVQGPVTADYIFTVKSAEFITIPFSKFSFLNENGDAKKNLPATFENGDVVLTTTGQSGNLLDGTVEARLNARELVILTPVTPFSNDVYQTNQLLTLTAATGEEVTVLIRTSDARIGASVADDSHFLDDDEVALPRLNFEGFSPAFTLGACDLKLSLEDGGAFDSTQFEAFIYGLGENYERVASRDISSLVQLDSKTPVLKIDQATLQNLRAELPIGLSELDFRLPQENDYNNVTVQFFNGYTTIEGQLVNKAGEPISPDVSQTGPLEILVTGVNTHYRRVVEIEPSGRFRIEDIPAGETYSLMVSDIRFPNLFGVFSNVPAETRRVDVEIFYVPKLNSRSK